MKRVTRGRLLVIGTEALLSVVLVLVFFLAALSVLGFAFPRGATLGDLVSGSVLPGMDPGVPVIETDYGAAPESPIVARLASVHRRVKDKRPDRIDWGESREGTPLEARHAVQTFEHSGAIITFDDRSRVTLGENSLLVVGAAPRGRGSRTRGVSLVVTGGDLRGSLSGAGPDSTEYDFVTPGGLARFRGRGRSTDFQVTVHPDKVSTFSVFRGSGEVTAVGRSVRLRANQSVTVAPGRPPGVPVELPPAPDLAGPDDGAVIAYRSVPPRVRLEWASAEAEGYRVQIARDREFSDLVDDTRVPGAGFVHGNLPAGDYYWRVSAMRGRAESEPSAARRIRVVEDLQPPMLSVDFLESSPGQGMVVLRGQTEPGCDVFVGESPISSDPHGRFEREVDLRPGWNVVVVEAIDGAGNASYRSRLLNVTDRSETRTP